MFDRRSARNTYIYLQALFLPTDEVTHTVCGLNNNTFRNQWLDYVLDSPTSPCKLSSPKS